MTTRVSLGEEVAELAVWATELRHDSVPPAVRARVRLLVADALGVMIAASGESEISAFVEQLPTATQARVFRIAPTWTTTEFATMANAMAMCAWELDSGSRPSGHPLVNVLPAALAEAQTRGGSGADLELATIVGYEVQARLGWATSLRSHVHAHGALGNLGAVAAIGHLRGWSAVRLTNALNIAASLSIGSPWLNAVEGATVRNAYAAASGQLAFTAARLAEAGYQASSRSITEVFGTILGSAVDPAALRDGLGERFWIEESYVKYHSACALVHPVIDALANALGVPIARPVGYPALALPAPLQPERIASVDVWVPDRSLKLNDVAPTTALGARFSIPFMAAAYLLIGNAGPSAASATTLASPAVRNVASRVRLHHDERLTRAWPASLGGRVEVRLDDGRVLHGECSDPIGSTAETITSDLLAAKFTYLTDGLLPASMASRIWKEAQRLDEIDDLRIWGLGV